MHNTALAQLERSHLRLQYLECAKVRSRYAGVALRTHLGESVEVSFLREVPWRGDFTHTAPTPAQLLARACEKAHNTQAHLPYRLQRADLAELRQLRAHILFLPAYALRGGMPRERSRLLQGLAVARTNAITRKPIGLWMERGRERMRIACGKCTHLAGRRWRRVSAPWRFCSALAGAPQCTARREGSARI